MALSFASPPPPQPPNERHYFDNGVSFIIQNKSQQKDRNKMELFNSQPYLKWENWVILSDLEFQDYFLVWWDCNIFSYVPFHYTTQENLHE